MNHTPSQLLARLLDGGPLPAPEAEALFTAVLDGRVAGPDLAAMLGAIAARGPSIDELVGAARAMRRRAALIPMDPTALPILDTCGTGGAPKLFNVSTVGAIIAAAAAPGRVLVAKHGNRSRTGRGSAEVLERLGVNIHAGSEVQRRCLREIGLCFAFAPGHHPAARHAAEVRRRLGFPTIFNLLGPLVNPAGATCQLVGTWSVGNARLLAHALARLGTRRALVVTSEDGLDEMTTTADNFLFHARDGVVAESRFDAASLGVPRASVADLRAHTLDEAATIVHAVLAGSPGPTLDIALLNAAASLHVAGIAHTIAEGLDAARSAVLAGRARRTLDLLISISNERV